MTNKKMVLSHILAVFTVIIWGTTFIFTKLLLENFSPFELLLLRFTIGFVALLIAYPHKTKSANIKHEFLFIFAALTGIILYMGLECIALKLTSTSNVGIIVSVSPLLTVLIVGITAKEKIKLNYLIGFVFAITGIIVVTFNGKFTLNINPIGDLLTVLACLCWAIYSVILRKIGTLGYNNIAVTRKIFFYGIIFLIPANIINGFELNFQRFISPSNIISILFLGLGASAFCFLSWNYCIKTLGPTKTNAYIYVVPVVTILVSYLVLNEKITVYKIIGTLLIIIGLILSEKNHKGEKQIEHSAK